MNSAFESQRYVRDEQGEELDAAAGLMVALAPSRPRIVARYERRGQLEPVGSKDSNAL
jgi:hypothetical protein